MSNSLDVLAQNRDALLLAEVAAWLHDMGKCDDELLKESASDFTGTKQYLKLYKTAHSHLVGSNLSLSFLGEPPVTIRDLIEQGKPGAWKNSHNPWLIRLLGFCHGIAHTEKLETYHLEKQTMADTRQSTPFGYEFAPITGLRAQLYALPFDRLSARTVFKPFVQDAFTRACGDTRRPLNDVTLWNWSGAVAAFYKAALALALLIGHTVEPDAIHWQLLGIRFDGVQFYEAVSRIPDLLTHQTLIEDSLRRVRSLLEENYPLGTEVYHDENGAVFLVPGIDPILGITPLLELKNSTEKSLRDLILEEFSMGTMESKFHLRLNGEILPQIEFNPDIWPIWLQQVQLNPPPFLPLSKSVLEVSSNQIDSSMVSSWWEDSTEDICTVCHIRPQGWGTLDNNVHYVYRARGKKCPSTFNCRTCKCLERKVCSICEQRRSNRSEQWLSKELNTTIWLDEIADRNGELGLVIGNFGLESWLDGNTLFYPGTKDATGKAQYKMIEASTPARLFRVWETTLAFWKSIVLDFKNLDVVGEVTCRLQIEGDFKPDIASQDSLGISHTYELKLANTNLSTVYKADGEYLTVDNLHRTALLQGASKAEYGDDSKAAEYIRGRLEGKSFDVAEPTGYGSPDKVLGKLQITLVSLENTAYTPAISILTEPQTFMALVPADKALQVAEAIKEKYEREMGKVRNRLPLTVGIVFAGRRTPLPAILDAGRRMLRQSLKNELWKVTNVDPPRPRSSWPGEVKLTLQREGQALSVKVSTIMGDGKTEDVWYPYWRLEKERENPDPRERLFKGIDGENWTHVSDLQIGDIVSFMPSRLDFEFLDTAARRFEVSYDDNGKRRGSVHPARPYCLEQLADLEELWKLLSEGLATSQIHNLIGLIEAKRMEWATDQDNPIFRDIFKEMLCEIIRNAGWKKDYLSEEQFKQLLQSAITGQLADVAELYISIHGKDNNGQGDNK